MLKLFTKHIKGYEKDAIKSPLFIAIEAICELFLPLLMADIIDVAACPSSGRRVSGCWPSRCSRSTAA